MSQPNDTPPLPEGVPGELPGDEHDETTIVPLKIEDWLTVIVMALLALITFANVLVRYFTSQSFAWTEEFSVFLMMRVVSGYRIRSDSCAWPSAWGLAYAWVWPSVVAL